MDLHRATGHVRPKDVTHDVGYDLDAAGGSHTQLSGHFRVKILFSPALAEGTKLTCVPVT